MAAENNLTNGEKLLIARRRRKENQTETAQRLGATYGCYSQWERDLIEPPKGVVPKISELKPWEQCLLQRRRAKVTQAEIAQQLGVCRWWVNLMERGQAPCEELLKYWEG